MHIACVHANLCGDPHAAPAELRELIGLPVDYWALGHVHSRRVLHEKPYIVYSGSPQGKDINEPGTQGCYIVDCDGFGGIEMRFHPTSVLEFQTVEVNINACANMEELLRKTVEETAPYKKERELLIRLKFTGITELDSELRFFNAGELHEMIREKLEREVPGTYLEEIILLTRTPLPPATAMVRAAELDAAEKEIAEEEILENIYSEMRTVFRELPLIRNERFEELRKEGSALLAEMLTLPHGGKR
jgi:DNA repair exonuclease SbcCD nuclease subunit